MTFDDVMSHRFGSAPCTRTCILPPRVSVPQGDQGGPAVRRWTSCLSRVSSPPTRPLPLLRVCGGQYARLCSSRRPQCLVACRLPLPGRARGGATRRARCSTASWRPSVEAAPTTHATSACARRGAEARGVQPRQTRRAESDTASIRWAERDRGCQQCPD